MTTTELALGEASIVTLGTGFSGRVKTPHGHVLFFFDEISQSRQSVDGVLEVHIDIPGEVFPTFVQRIDIRSASAIDGLTTRLNNAFGGKRDERGYNWSLILNTFVSKLSRVIKGKEIAISLRDIPFTEPEFLLYPFLQKDATNLVFASSEVGKTWFVQRMALSLVTGQPFLSFPAIAGNKVLYLDYEDSAMSFASRLHKLCRGMDVSYEETVANILYYKPSGSLRNNLEIVRRMVADNLITLMVIDAGGDAAGGSPNDEEKVLDMFNALEEIPITKLMLHHEPKYVQSEAAAFYGSMYWKARARVAWRIEAESEEDNSKLLKLTIQKKSNLPPQPTYYYRQTFMGVPTDREWNFEQSFIPSVILLREDVVSTPTSRRSLDEQIIEVLLEEPLTEGQIAQLVGRDKSNVGKRLRNLKEMGKVIQVKKGKSILWKLK